MTFSLQMVYHSNPETHPFKCDKCPKTFVRKIKYNQHLESHENNKQHTCE